MEWDRYIKIDRLESQLASAADLVNSWCREVGVWECESPYSGLQLREAIDRVWEKVSGDREKSIVNACIHERERIARIIESGGLDDGVQVATLEDAICFGPNVAFARAIRRLE